MRRIGRVSLSTRPARTRSQTAIRIAVAVALVAGTGATVVPATSAVASATVPAFLDMATPSPPGPPVGNLGGVSCSSATDCVAVGANDLEPMAEHWNGTGWKIVGVPAPGGASFSELDAVSCPSANECFAVGDSETDTATTFVDKSLIERWNGTGWTIVPSPNPTGPSDNVQLGGVSCASTTSCFAVGNATNSSDVFFTAKTLVEHWDGTTWSIVASPNPAGAVDSELNGVSCTSATSCFAAGDTFGAFSFGQLIEQWDGTSWTISPNPPPIGPLAASASGGSAAGSSAPAPVARGPITPAAMLRTGSPAAAAVSALAPTGSASAHRASSAGARADGASFGTVPGLNDVSCSSPTSCVAVGISDNGALTEQWNGTAWAIVAVPSLPNTDGGEMLGISCPKSTDCTAVGDYSTPSGNDPFVLSHTLAEHWNGTSWSVELLGLGTVFSQLGAVSCINSHNCEAVGDSAFVQQWNGRRWSIAPFTSRTSQSTLADVACTAATHCLAVGRAITSTGSTTLVEELDGNTWSVIPSPNPGASEAALFAIDCPAARSCFAVGGYERGETVYPLVEHWNGTTWSIVLVPSPARSELSEFTDVSCPSAVSCTAVGLSLGADVITPIAESWNGARWVIDATGATGGADISELIGVSCVAPSDCNAVGEADKFTTNDITSNALIEHWNGLSWVTVPNPSPGGAAELSGVSCVATDNCNAVGAVQTTSSISAPLAEHWDGFSWKVVAVPSPPHAEESGLGSLACHSAISCYAVGGYSTATTGRTLVEHWNGSGWTVVSNASPTAPPEGIGLNAVSYPTRTACIAVGGYSTIFGSFTLAERYG